jgi:uncharacterized membrane protein
MTAEICSDWKKLLEKWKRVAKISMFVGFMLLIILAVVANEYGKAKLKKEQLAARQKNLIESLAKEIKLTEK